VLHQRIQWHYLRPDKDDDKIPALFIHGFMGSGDIWRPIIEKFAGDIDAVAIDLPGHGRTKADLGQLTFDSLAQSLAEFAGERFSRPPHVIGYSLGGRVALYTALAFPDLFAGLFLESSSPGIDDKSEKTARMELDEQRAEKLRQMGMEGFLREWYTLPIYDSLKQNPELIEKIIARKKTGDAASLAEAMVRLSPGVQPSLWDKLPQVNHPVTIIAGERDAKYCDIARRMAAIMPTADLRIIPDAGHIVHFENRAEFVTALKFFLSAYIL